MGSPPVSGQAHQVAGGDAAFAGQGLDAAQLDGVFAFEPFPGDPGLRRRAPVTGALGHAVEFQQPADGRRGAARHGADLGHGTF
jgi:hypothetical protein